jgi:hypothetical protein
MPFRLAMDTMTDPDAPPPIDPPAPEIDPGAAPDEIEPGPAPMDEPPMSPPIQPGDDRPYG